MNIGVLLVLLFYGAMLTGSVILVIWAIINRCKEKKIEKEKHKDYDKY